MAREAAVDPARREGGAVASLTTAGPGIRAKLNIGLGVVVLVSALAFGSVYALVERATILGEKRDHLVHLASMAALSFQGVDGSLLSTQVAEFSRHLSEATGALHRIRIEDATGRTIVGSEPATHASRVRADGTGIWHALFPSTMIGETSIQMGPGAAPARLIVEESLEGLPEDVRASLLRHVAFAALLLGLVALSTSLLAHFLILRPVRELAAAADRIGADGAWEPFSPSIRRRDELGILCDRFAELSRRLQSAVRDERYGSAHLVALGVERGLEEPVRHAEMELALLQASLPAGSEELGRCANLAAHLDEIAEVGRRLKTIGGHPPSSGA